MLPIDEVWLAVDPLDMRAGFDAAPAWVAWVAWVFRAAHCMPASPCAVARGQWPLGMRTT